MIQLDAPAELRRQFDERHHVVIPRLFGPELLAWIQKELADAPFRETNPGGFAGELTLDRSSRLTARLLFRLNDPSLYRAIEAITGVSPLARYDGRIYRRLAVPEHFDDWHDDLAGAARRVTMSVNLSEDHYEGGVTEIRYKGSTELLGAVHNTGPGDALLFRVSPEMQHRVTTVTGGVKTAIAGWFGSAPVWPEPVAEVADRAERS